MISIKYVRAKEYLGRARHIEMLLKVKQDELRMLQNQLSASQTQDVKVKSSAVNDRMKIVDAIIDFETDVLRESEALIALKKEIHDRINQLSNPLYVGILTEYYINNKPWRVISEELDLSERHLYRAHGNALNEFQKKFEME